VAQETEKDADHLSIDWDNFEVEDVTGFVENFQIEKV